MAKKETKQSEDLKSNESFLNPFTPGVTYDQFTEAMGEKTVSEYCQGELTQEQIEWLEADLKHYKKNK